MSKTNKIFSAIPVEIPDRSGFDLSHEVLTTAKTGTVIPISHIEVVPGDTVSCGAAMKVTLPPFAVPFMGRIDAEITAAFIPNRLLWQGWQSFITQNNGVNPGNVSVGGDLNVPMSVPNFIPSRFSAQEKLTYLGPGTLLDYLGFKANSSSLSADEVQITAMPALAYQKFCDDWVRDENNIKPFFPKINPRDFVSRQAGESIVIGGDRNRGRFLPFEATITGSTVDSGSYPFTINSVQPADGSDNPDSYLYSMPFDTTVGPLTLRQRCWAKDYFTTATTRPQAGADSSVTFAVNGTIDEPTTGGAVTGSGGFTIATLRAANALQRWLERNNIAGTDYGSQILAHFGVTPPDAVLNRSVLLGSVRTPVYVSGVENNTPAGGSGAPNNPFGQYLGSAAGFGSGSDKGSLIDNFTAKEHGYIMFFFTLIPHAYYNTGVKRSLLHINYGDFAWPEFAGIGDQDIRMMEISAGTAPGTFGYNQRYSEYKFELDRISGLLADGNNLSPYALQRGFGVGNVALGKEFLEIPTNFLDQVTGVSSELAEFGCMIDAFFDMRALRVLPEYSLPHL